MGNLQKGLASVLSFGLGGKLLSDSKKTNQLSNSLSNAPFADTKVAESGVIANAEDLKKRRVSLFATSGGPSGQEVAAGGTSKRNTLFGN